MIQISVLDTGTGIKNEDKSKLFKLFGFLEATKDLNTKGVGLGLHISQQIAYQLGGEICFTSEYGRGSTFTFVVDLEEMNNEGGSIRRYLNP